MVKGTAGLASSNYLPLTISGSSQSVTAKVFLLRASQLGPGRRTTGHCCG